jgi:predicted secreted protein
MPVRKARDLTLYIGDGGAPEAFLPVAAARLSGIALSSRPADATALGSGAARRWLAEAGTQDMEVKLEGLFRDQPGEALLRAAAFAGAAVSCRLDFPNGDSYAAPFVVRDYARGGQEGGFEEFAVTLLRAGGGIFTAHGS